ncbi:MAG: hypothetical protein WA724_06665 [Candidatus Dormiibacterota bacterium]
MESLALGKSALPHHALEAIHNDLIRVLNAVYWLRLYATNSGGHVAVVTEVPGNPGLNAMNGLDGIVKYLQDVLAVDLARLDYFQIWPSGYLDATTDISRVLLGAHPRWRKVARAEIEALVGVLAPLPDHQQLLGRVTALGGWERHPYFRDVFAAYPVRNLPPPHGPFKCAHTSRYDTILGSLEGHGGDYMDRDLQAGSIFLQSLTSADLATCSTYHRANWHAIADESVAIITELGIRDDKGDYQKETERRLRGTDRVETPARYASATTIPAPSPPAASVPAASRGSSSP